MTINYNYYQQCNSLTSKIPQKRKEKGRGKKKKDENTVVKF